MAEPTNAPTRGQNRLWSIFGVNNSTVAKLVPEPKFADDGEIASGSFSKTEMVVMNRIGQEERYDNGLNAVRGMLEATANGTAGAINRNKSFKQMTPEIDKARSVLIPSIMSPNDLQGDSLKISVDLPELGAETNKAITELLNKYFNDELALGENVARWIGDALFEKGAQPVMLIPKAMIRKLGDASAVAEQPYQSTKSKMKIHASYEKIIPTVPTEPKMHAGFESLVPRSGVSMRVSMEQMSHTALEACQDFMDSLCESLPEDVKQEQFTATFVSDTKELVKTLIEKLRPTTTATEALLGVSHDYRTIVDPIRLSRRKSSQVMKSMSKTLFGDEMNRFAVMTSEDPVEAGDHPAWLALPTEAVVPITIPGDPAAHFGYYVLLDENGCPISADELERSGSDECINRAIIRSGGHVISGFSSKSMTNRQKYDATCLVYDTVIKSMLQHDLGRYDVTNVSVSQHRAIANCMFQRFLRGQKVRTVFVPKDLMVYYAFQYRPDGTGKSLLEDSSFVLSMRATLFVANVMSALRNSTEKKKITFNVGKEATNQEQLASAIHEIYIKKNMPGFGTDPLAVAREIVSKSISIVPKGMKGLEDLDVTTESVPAANIKPDTDMLEVLTKQIVTMLKVPNAALNEVGENEYARSVVTQNLFFANEVRGMQKPTVRCSTEFIRNYTMLSFSLTKSIAELVNKSEAATDNPNRIGSDDVVMNDEAAGASADLVDKVIRSITVTLPSPTMAFDKAQHEEVNAQIDTFSKFVDQIFNPDLVQIEATDAPSMMKAVAQMVKANGLRSILSSVGVNRSMVIPEMDDINLYDLQSVQRFARNIQQMMVGLNKFTKPGDPAADGSTPAADSSAPADDGMNLDSGIDTTALDAAAKGTPTDEAPADAGDKPEEPTEDTKAEPEADATKPEDKPQDATAKPVDTVPAPTAPTPEPAKTDMPTLPHN